MARPVMPTWILFGQPAGVGDVAGGAEGAAPSTSASALDAPADAPAPPMPYADADHRRRLLELGGRCGLGAPLA